MGEGNPTQGSSGNPLIPRVSDLFPFPCDVPARFFCSAPSLKRKSIKKPGAGGITVTAEGNGLPTSPPKIGHGLGDIRLYTRSSASSGSERDHPSGRAPGCEGGSASTKQGNDLAEVTWSWGRAQEQHRGSSHPPRHRPFLPLG